MNLSDLLDGNLSGRMKVLGDALAAEWARIARTKLGRTLGPYIKSIGVREVTPSSVTVALPGPAADPRAATLARMVEFGMGPGGIGSEGPYDIRTFLLRAGTRKLKWGKNGPYVNVPFPRRGARSEVPGPLEIERLGGRSALARARKLAARTMSPDGRLLTRGDRMGAGFAAKLRAHHVADPLAGMVRQTSSYSAGVRQTSGYMLWRRASWANRDPAAWKSPGVKAHHIARQVDIGRVLREVF